MRPTLWNVGPLPSLAQLASVDLLRFRNLAASSRRRYSVGGMPGMSARTVRDAQGLARILGAAAHPVAQWGCWDSYEVSDRRDGACPTECVVPAGNACRGVVDAAGRLALQTPSGRDWGVAWP